jgi:hypothetical protein
MDGIVERHALSEIVNRHVLELDLLCTIDISGVGKNADGHAGSGPSCKGKSNSHDEGKKDTLDCARKTLISLWVVILQTNLKFDSLDEISFLLVASASNSLSVLDEPRTLDTESLELPYRVSTLFRIHSSTHLML